MGDKCFVAVSGGVDSAVALALLKNKYTSVEGVTMVPFGRELVPEASLSEALDAKALCEKMGVTHHTLDLSREFRETVVRDFCDSYARGETPNPCVVCNRYIKFGALLDYSRSLGASAYATGHYVRTARVGDRRVILRASDPDKDQSYVLWNLSAEQISRFEAPLGEYTKPQVREIASSLGLSVASKSDSQDICFIPDGDYRAFLSRVAGDTDTEGDFIRRDGKILGRHGGQRRYTVGQRKGLGIAYSEPLYVIGRNMAENQVILGSNADLFTSAFRTRNANFSALDYPKSDIMCEVRIRYRALPVRARVIPLGDRELLVETDTPVRAATPGQSAVFYDGDTLLGGSVITPPIGQSIFAD